MTYIIPVDVVYWYVYMKCDKIECDFYLPVSVVVMLFTCVAIAAARRLSCCDRETAAVGSAAGAR